MEGNTRIGQFVESLPVPHDPEATDYFEAGVLTIGIEYRRFDPVLERAKLTAAEIAAAGPDSLFSGDDIDEGLSVHVFATENLAEYLRFDCFTAEPHYHYIRPPQGNMLVHFDATSNGPMVPWAFHTLRARLAAMLDSVEAHDLAAGIDPEVLGEALDRAEATARRQVARSAAGGV